MNSEHHSSQTDVELSRQPSATTIRAVLREATACLQDAGIAEAGLDAATLLMFALNCDRTFLIVNPNLALDENTRESFQQLIARRARREPVQHITRHQEFYNLEFEVNADVLIPRPETELIVEAALELLGDVRAPRICDVGTGSGAITIALLHERADARAVAIDLSTRALAVAQRNAVRHEVESRIRFVASDCFDALRDNSDDSNQDLAGGSIVKQNAWQPFHLIVSNPPYIAEDELDALQPEVRDFEPRRALTPGTDALAIIKRLLHDAPQFLIARGHLIFEIGFDQSRAVGELIDDGTWQVIDVRRDLQSIARTFVLQKK